MIKRHQALLVMALLGLCATGCGTVFVPKQHGLGWTLNWSSPYAYVIVALIIAFVVWRILAGNKKT